MLIRIGLTTALLIGVILAKWKFPAVFGGVWYWSHRAAPTIVRGIGIASAILLIIVTGVLIWDRFVRMRHRHSYDAQMGRSLTTGMIVFLLIVMAVLALGAAFRSRLIVMSIGICTIGVSAMLLGGFISEGVKAVRKKGRIRSR